MQSYEFFVKTEKRHIDFINKIFEGYEGFGVVRTLDSQNGLIKIISVDCFIEEVKNILQGLNDRYDVKLEITKHGVWEGIL